jgi:hypothetical protein
LSSLTRRRVAILRRQLAVNGCRVQEHRPPVVELADREFFGCAVSQARLVIPAVGGEIALFGKHILAVASHFAL